MSLAETGGGLRLTVRSIAWDGLDTTDHTNDKGLMIVPKTISANIMIRTDVRWAEVDVGALGAWGVVLGWSATRTCGGVRGEACFRR